MCFTTLNGYLVLNGRQKELKPKRIVETVACQAPATSKKTEILTPLLATREKKTSTNGFSLRSNERAEKKKEVYIDNLSHFYSVPNFRVKFLSDEGTFYDAVGEGGSCGT